MFYDILAGQILAFNWRESIGSDTQGLKSPNPTSTLKIPEPPPFLFLLPIPSKEIRAQGMDGSKTRLKDRMLLAWTI
jgi:hypothetical protein